MLLNVSCVKNWDGMEVRNSSHNVYKTEYHLVFCTKFRRKILNPGFTKYVETIIGEVIDMMERVGLIEINAQVDHIHMVLIIPPKYAVAKVAEIIKSRTAKKMRNKFNWLDKVYWGTRSLWSVGYFVSTVGINEKIIRQYVKFQQKQDSGQQKLKFG